MRAGLRVERDHLVARRRDEHHAVVDDRRRLVAVGDAGGDHPRRLQPRDVGRRDLIERAVAPAVVGAPDHQPVAGVGILQALGRHRLVVPQHGRHRRRRRRRQRRRAIGLRRSAQRTAAGRRGRDERARNATRCFISAFLERDRRGERLRDDQLSRPRSSAAAPAAAAAPDRRRPCAVSRIELREVTLARRAAAPAGSQSSTSQPVCVQIAV